MGRWLHSSPEAAVEEDEVSYPPPIDGIYPFGEPGHPIVIHRGPGFIDGDAVDDIYVRVALKREVRVCWSIPADARMKLAALPMRLDRPHIGEVELSVEVNHSVGRGTIQVEHIGGAEDMARVVSHWLNLPDIWRSQVLSDGRALGLVDGCSRRPIGASLSTPVPTTAQCSGR